MPCTRPRYLRRSRPNGTVTSCAPTQCSAVIIKTTLFSLHVDLSYDLVVNQLSSRRVRRWRRTTCSRRQRETVITVLFCLTVVSRTSTDASRISVLFKTVDDTSVLRSHSSTYIYSIMAQCISVYDLFSPATYILLLRWTSLWGESPRRRYGRNIITVIII